MKNKTEIVCIIDKSGSMASIKNDAIGGFNSFLEEQKKVEGEASITLVTFSYSYDIKTVVDNVDIQEVKELTNNDYIPGGNTALYDAIGKTLINVGRRLSDLSEDERPNKVIVVILTDGEENASVEFTSKQILEMITHQKDVYSWEFIYLGANQDAFAVGTSMGIVNTTSYVADSLGTRKAFASYSADVTCLRRA